jgi:hypothetical protein
VSQWCSEKRIYKIDPPDGVPWVRLDMEMVRRGWVYGEWVYREQVKERFRVYV